MSFKTLWMEFCARAVVAEPSAVIAGSKNITAEGKIIIAGSKNIIAEHQKIIAEAEKVAVLSLIITKFVLTEIFYGGKMSGWSLKISRLLFIIFA